MSQQFRAVLFDVGGVIVDYKDREKYLKLYKMVEETPHLFELLESFERGLIKPTDIKPEFLSLLGVNPNVQLKDSAVVKNMGEKNPIVERAIDLIHKSGNYKLAILTNNGFWKEEQTTSFIEPDHRFHYIIESCRIGHRKPDASFYEYALNKMELTASECVFIDDLEKNCLGAEAVGIKSIWLKEGDSSSAITQLEKLLNFKLL
ncbi:hypothetical protein Mgra_00006431 [Meloidogyne graminicola]|uniref:Uncharacterized protein n=1 Tax=Meloidogyne graminicola TaxID=189291 RepID=A0A8S9ZLG8_9BILA|nr:hypothetical protein Mgra_00006431 [Meloidogyne graminicola]